MTRIDLTYRVHVSTAMHIGTGMGFAKVVDDLVVRAGPGRDEGTRLPCLPGSSLKGKIRSRCEAVAWALGLRVCEERKCTRHLCIICRLFGSPYAPGELHFGDALLVAPWRRVGHRLGSNQTTDGEASDPFVLTTIRAGNKLERATRTVAPDFLFAFEHTADGLHYEGSIAGQVESHTLPGMNVMLPLEGWLLVVGLRTVDKIGGLHSRGLGRCRTTVTSLRIDTGEDVAGSLDTLLAQDDYFLGLSEYEA
jgi:CRISPR/Cas system CSM-associated protein Csm3 (group 7 of RAMP superfamily)